MKKILIILLVCLVFPTINSDVISLNSGGSETIVINPDTYIEGFFQCVPYSCADFGYNCGTWDDGCGININCGTCSSGYTCTSGNCVISQDDGGAGGGGGGGEGGVTTPITLRISPTEFNINLAINTNTERTITVTNLKTSPINVNVRQQGLDNMVIINKSSFTLGAGESKELDVVFVALSQPGIYVGKIFIGDKQILVSLNIKTKLLLFDSNIVVLNKDYQVARGDKLKTEVTLIPMGDEERLDVTLNCVIKDYDNRTYLTWSETLLVEEQTNLKRDFDTGNLPIGNYVVGLELIYPNGVAPSSAHFEVIEKTPMSSKKWIFVLLILILIILILIIIILIKRHLQKEAEA